MPHSLGLDSHNIHMDSSFVLNFGSGPVPTVRTPKPAGRVHSSHAQPGCPAAPGSVVSSLSFPCPWWLLLAHLLFDPGHFEVFLNMGTRQFFAEHNCPLGCRIFNIPGCLHSMLRQLYSLGDKRNGYTLPNCAWFVVGSVGTAEALPYRDPAHTLWLRPGWITACQLCTSRFEPSCLLTWTLESHISLEGESLIPN